jgi:transmembrane sensor
VDLLKPRRAEMGSSGRFLAVAATALVASIGLLVWWSSRPTVDVYRTDVGGFSRVPLSDGSTVSLNTDSEVRVRLGSSIREVTLIRGEALFDVAHDTRRPFDVHAGSTVVRAVGTSFDVRRRGAEEVDVVVTDGKVLVRSDKSAVEGAMDTSPTAIVTAGEAATAGTTRLDVKKVDPRDTTRRLAWQAGELAFQGESLGEVINEFNRYSRRHLELADPSLQNIRVGGNFKAIDVDSFIAALHTSFGLVGAPDEHGTVRIRRDTSILDAAPPAIVTQQ